jgi:uncharacterized repeat protein (TIGR03803 family)
VAAVSAIRVQAQVYQKVFTFTNSNTQNATGANPQSAMILARDGNFYGTTEYGGALNEGTVFKMTPAGVVTTIAEFGTDPNNPGINPTTSLVQGYDGNLYGTTSSDSDGYNSGTIFEVTTSGVLTTLVQFTGNAYFGFGYNGNGYNPNSALVQGSDGNLYGTTASDSLYGAGTVFMVTPNGENSELTTLVQFTGNSGNNPGQSPNGLVQGSDGNFYGTTEFGGASGNGTIFQMAPGGTLNTLIQLTGTDPGNPGIFPEASLVQAGDGNFYGTTSTDGAAGNGTVFRVTPAGVLSTLVVFSGSSGTSLGSNPQSALVIGADGSFYGATESGGAAGNGTFFRILPSGLMITLTDLTSAAANPNGLVQGTDGNFYGTTQNGGADGLGSVIQITPIGALTTIANFIGNSVVSSGIYPGALLQTSGGNLYGTATGGGADSNGLVFTLTPDGVLTNLALFTGTSGNNPGSGPNTLIAGPDGNFYGTTGTAGANNDGTVFSMTPGGTLTDLVDFTGTNGSALGSDPNVLITGTDGNFYGTTSAGGAYGDGTVFKMTPNGTLETLVVFSGLNGTPTPGANPTSLIQGTDGNFYGTTMNGGINDESGFYGNGNGYGTVFKLTPSGALTYLTMFSSTNASAYPNTLIEANGNLYGTTEGANYGNGEFFSNDDGSVFEVTLSGSLSFVTTFTDSDTTPGADPTSLVQGSDGNLYGTTVYGGASYDGNVFELTPGGTLSTIFDFTADPVYDYPAGLIQGTDGNLYGTTNGMLQQQNNFGQTTYGSVYSIIFQEVPDVFSISAALQPLGIVGISAKVNARGSFTTAFIRYGTNGVSFPYQIPLSPTLDGYLSAPVGATLRGLSQGVTYYYQIVATNGSGTTTTPVATFTTLVSPVAIALPASAILNTSAQFNGTVNAGNYNTAVVFQYGTDGVTFPNTVTTTMPATVTGTANTTVTAAVAGLVEGVTYYYRIVATNSGGTTASGAASFTTLTPPTATVAVGAAMLLSTVSAQVSGTVNAQGSPTHIVVQYGTDPNGIDFPLSTETTPSTASGDTDTPVTAVLNNLSQGTTYYYQIVASSAGGSGTSAVDSFTLALLADTNYAFPNSPPPADGSVQVNLSPLPLPGTTLLPGWRFVGEENWLPSGTTVSDLVSGTTYAIEYEPAPGFTQPVPEYIDVISGQSTVLNRSYLQNTSEGTGTLTVTLLPGFIAASGSAQWELVGEDGTQWRASGATTAQLPAGSYQVECLPVNGFATPAPEAVNILAGGTNGIAITYPSTEATVGTSPSVVPYQSVLSGTNLPYAYVGQIQTDAGSATGFVVSSRVVATAGHVVFDDYTLSYTTGVQWLLQQYVGTYQPAPIVPAGFYVFGGYSAQRISDINSGAASPGVGTIASENLDAAALFFLQDAGNGGYGGYLASDSVPNEFLVSSSNKMLVGYPVDNIPTAEQGELFATPRADIHFSEVQGLAASGTAIGITSTNYQVYTTTDITSESGNSGGPICVQYKNGLYYPAAIYLGGSGETVVRAINGDVVNMFNFAEASGNGGPEEGNGGIVEHSSPIGAQLAPSTVQVTIEPAGAISAGATWTFGGSGPHPSGYVLNNVAPATSPPYTLHLSAANGFVAPADQSYAIENGRTYTFTATYAVDTSPPTITSSLSLSGSYSDPLSYQIKAAHDATGFNATSLPLGLSVNTSTGLISGTPQVVGTFSVPITASNSYGSVTQTLVMTILSPYPPATLTVNANPSNEGTVSGSGTYTVGTYAQISATANAGYMFTGWSDGVTSNPRTILVPESGGTYTADFAPQVGSVSVTLLPAGAVSSGALWSVDGGLPQISGTAVNGLSLGSHTVTFGTATGYTSPVPQDVTVSANQTTMTTGTYVLQTGSLSVILSPTNAVAAGAQWNVDAGPYQNSGATVGGLQIGSHTVGFKIIPLFLPPANQNQNVNISFNQTTMTTGTYVSSPLPVITSRPTASGSQGLLFNYQITATDNPTSFNATALPTGLSVSTGSGLISGTPITFGTFASTISAINTSGTQSGVLVIVIAPTGSLTVTLTLYPAGTVATTAQWTLDGGAPQDSGAILAAVPTGNHTVGFTPIDGYASPAAQSITIVDAQTLAASGTYVAIPVISVTQLEGPPLTSGSSTVDFGAVTSGSTTQQTFTILNNGAANLAGITAGITGLDASEFQPGTPASQTLVPGGSTTLAVTYSPGNIHASAATLHITSNDPVTPSFDIGLTATGTNGPVNLHSAAGAFVGLVQESGTDGGTTYPGYTGLTLDANGRLTGKLVFEGATFTVKGSFDANNNFSGKPGILGLILTSGSGGIANPAGYWMDGSVSGQDGPVPFIAYHAAYARGEKVPEDGKYTVLLSSTNMAVSIPQGTGYAFATVARTGGDVTIDGKLADGTAFSASGVLVSGANGDQFLLYDDKLYADTGLLAGPIVFDRLSGSDCDAVLEWMRSTSDSKLYPQGFDASLDLAGSIYVKPGRGIVLPGFSDGILSLSDGGIGSPILQSVAVSAKGDLVASGSNPVDLKIAVDTSTGGISGSFTDPVTGKPVRFYGVLYQNMSLPGAGGFFIGPILDGTSLSGNVILSP